MAAVGWTRFMLFLLLNISMGKNAEQLTEHCDVGQTVTLPCKHTMSNCSMVFWLLNSKSNLLTTVELVVDGKVKDTQRSGRLTVGSDCSLHINNLNAEDTGLYTCRLYHNDSNFTDISTLLSVGERYGIKEERERRYIKETEDSDTKTNCFTPVVSQSTLSSTDIKIYCMTLTAATTIPPPTKGIGDGSFPVVAVTASGVAVCVGVCVTVVIILIYNRTPEGVRTAPYSRGRLPSHFRAAGAACGEVLSLVFLPLTTTCLMTAYPATTRPP
ncbi:uncharacterized protein LOC108941931 [Scleropages formosus]|uniref:uncharacterized protein LOC108941931 n=1 Tax=Scleropages formosus TaxID=113540 RepID=UPI000878800C|nr:uncharacterized protein LOC108941931 [Scleropages formosus]